MSENKKRAIVSIDGEAVAAFFVLGFVASCFSAWITHIGWVVIKLSSDHGITFGQFILAAIGTLFFPVGIIHGFLIWMGLR